MSREDEDTGTPYLLQFEDVLVEVVLQPLVGEVDAELFEAVVLVVLEAEDVQDSYRQNLVRKTDGLDSFKNEILSKWVNI